jgi:hypothetical protein
MILRTSPRDLGKSKAPMDLGTTIPVDTAVAAGRIVQNSLKNNGFLAFSRNRSFLFGESIFPGPLTQTKKNP